MSETAAEYEPIRIVPPSGVVPEPDFPFTPRQAEVIRRLVREELEAFQRRMTTPTTVASNS